MYMFYVNYFLAMLMVCLVLDEVDDELEHPHQELLLLRHPDPIRRDAVQEPA